MKKKFPKSVLKIEFNNFFCFLIKLLTIVLLLFSCFIKMNAQWEPLNNGPGNGAINCFLVDGNNTYTGTVWGVFMTTDNGNNWTAKNTGFKGQLLTSIESLAISGNNIFAGTILYGIFLSTDKGENWVQKSNGLPYYVLGSDTVISEEVFEILINENNIFAGTENGVYISSNNGDNWILKNNGLPQFDTNKREVFSMAVSGNNIFAGTRFGVYLTTDNGYNWFPKNKGIVNMTIYSIVINGDNIYAGTRYGIFISTDNGDNWKNIGFKDTAMVSIIIKSNNIFIGGYGIYLSTDNGNSWSAKNLGLTDLAIISLIINGDYIFAGTNSYGIFRAKLSDLGITDVKETEQTNEIKIFPNPASDEFRLRFHAPTETTVQLSVFDLLGNLVFSQALQSTEGMNEKTINCEKLPSGYYYVKINANENVQSIPLMIIK